MFIDFKLPRQGMVGFNGNLFVYETDSRKLFVYYGNFNESEFIPLWHEQFQIRDGHPYEKIVTGVTWNGDLVDALLDELENPDRLADYELTPIGREVLEIAEFAGIA